MPTEVLEVMMNATDTPWLITNDDSSSLFRLFSSTLKQNFFMYKPFKPLRGSFIVGSFKGCLVIRSPVKIFILNIFSRFQIQLPPRTTMPQFLKSKINASNVKQDYPLTLAMSTCGSFSPLILAGVTFLGDLVWCNIGDKEWKGYRDDDDYGNLTFYNDMLYAITRDGTRIDMFRIQDRLVKLDAIACPNPTVPPSEYMDVYLVDCKGTLVVAKRYYYTSQGHTIAFHLFKVQGNVVVDLDNLGDQALFVSTGLSAECVTAKDCKGLENPNRLFFIGRSEDGLKYEFGMVSVERKRNRLFRVTLPHTTMHSSPFWLLPRFASACDCKCHDPTLWTTKAKCQLHTNLES
ncbi:hypothetical protein RJT34_25906 [Clitoria ternatea]|uniref:KIB1-4 beta-propeller domain-containing protein n=1 Tax=Clitoria ternatea TaxID=43366 RepID=A0AAN9IA73_CLITE